MFGSTNSSVDHGCNFRQWSDYETIEYMTELILIVKKQGVFFQGMGQAS